MSADCYFVFKGVVSRAISLSMPAVKLDYWPNLGLKPLARVDKGYFLES